MYGWVIYRQEDIEENRHFIEELITSGRNLGIDLRLVVAQNIDVDVPIKEKLDFVLNRSRSQFLAIHFQEANIATFNNTNVAMVGTQKNYGYELMDYLGIPCLPYQLIDHYHDKLMFDYPFVLKPNEGHGGQDVVMVEDQKMYDKIKKNYHLPYIVQQPSEQKGREIRVYVINNRVYKVIEKINNKDFRANFKQGAEVRLSECPNLIDDYVKQIITAIKPFYCGIDFIVDGDKYYFNEIEDAVGSRSLFQLGIKDTPDQIMQAIKKIKAS